MPTSALCVGAAFIVMGVLSARAAASPAPYFTVGGAQVEVYGWTVTEYEWHGYPDLDVGPWPELGSYKSKDYIGGTATT